MRCTSYSPFVHYEKANEIYETELGRDSPKFLDSLRKIADTKLRKFEYYDNIELYRIDTRSFSEIPDISLSTNDKKGLDYQDSGSFYSHIEKQMKEKFDTQGEYEQKYSMHMKNLIYSAYVQIYILRNGKKSRPNIVELSEIIAENWIKLHGEYSIFCLNTYLGLVWAYGRNNSVQIAEEYAVKMIDIIQQCINSMSNQYSLVSNIHIGVIYFILKQTARANSLFKEILEQELEYVKDEKYHMFLEQIYLHFAIMFQSMHQNKSAYVMWKNLLKCHKQQYISDSSYLSKDYYNIGKWYTELEELDKAMYNVSIKHKIHALFSSKWAKISPKIWLQFSKN